MFTHLLAEFSDSGVLVECSRLAHITFQSGNLLLQLLLIVLLFLLLLIFNAGPSGCASGQQSGVGLVRLFQ